jgi:hypothetical protein
VATEEFGLTDAGRLQVHRKTVSRRTPTPSSGGRSASTTASSIVSKRLYGSSPGRAIDKQERQAHKHEQQTIPGYRHDDDGLVKSIVY